MQKLFVQTPYLANEIIRISSYMVDGGIAKLKEKKAEENIIVHDLRKCVKNLRALLRLIKKEIGEESFKKNNFLLRDLNRKSAALRNTFALIILTENICAVNKLEQLNEPLNLLLIRLKNDFEVIKSGTDYDSLFNNYLATFENYKSRISQMFFDELRFRNIKEELKKIYADSLKYFDLSIKTKNENELHEWRKNVKDLYYCFFSLTPLWKPVISVFTKELKTLSDLLGDLHDLFELKIYIQSLIDNPFDFTEIISVIELNQVEIIEKSISLGKRLFAEDEEQFALRIKSYFSVFKKEQKMLAPKS